MIKDSSYWRADLLRQACQLDLRQKQIRWTHVSFTRTEQSVMPGFYSIRKIFEAGKASPRMIKSVVHLTQFERNHPRKLEVVAPLLNVYYDLDHPRRVQHDLWFLCHQVVHSYVFSIAVGYETGFSGVYFASDRQQNVGPFFLRSDDLIDIFRHVGEDAQAEFSGWVEDRLPSHRVRTAFPPPSRMRPNSRMNQPTGPFQAQ